MKKQFFFSMLAAAAMLASCSSEDAIAPDKGGNEYGMIEGQPAFISLGIAMPDGASTRANDDVNDGIAEEYEVKSGRLVLFKGSTEASATLWKQYDITDNIKAAADWGLESSSTQITSTSKKFVQEIESPALGASDKLWAYVILNDKNNLTVTCTPGTTFPIFGKQILTAIGIADETTGYGSQNANGLVMTSVPLSPTKGGSAIATGAPYTLTPINASAVYPTKAEAELSTAAVACCYVERAAVKVDVTVKASITDPTGSGTIDNTKVTWGLGNVNNNASGYHNTRQFDAAWMPYINKQVSNTDPRRYRFVSVNPLFASDHMEGYRTYFGSDVNYNGNVGLINSQVTTYPIANGGKAYTYENTFDENSQIYANTTFVSLKVELNNGTTFYTIDGENNTALNLAALRTKLANKVDEQIKVSTIDPLIAEIQSKITADLANSSGVLRTAGFNASDVIEFTLAHNITLAGSLDAFNRDTYTDHLVFNSITVNSSTATTAQETAIKSVEFITSQTIQQKLEATELVSLITPEKVFVYTNGIAYYATRIAHFGDTETPWNTESASYNNYNKIYPTDGQALGVIPSDYGTNRANAWLGRWGIVRNNWYSIVVDDIKGIGDATPLNYNGTATGPDGDVPGNTPDDNPTPKYYIAAHIHILPWVKRTQNVEF
ncbi:MAG: Mfa1 fimbrilin C-terminal domain-containing protein [Prevotellaceae bacterium]|nr:Mfa1 fimbrilin C-terminal domain-containing protein [Candidatus Minthosoma equi]